MTDLASHRVTSVAGLDKHKPWSWVWDKKSSTLASPSYSLALPWNPHCPFLLGDCGSLIFLAIRPRFHTRGVRVEQVSRAWHDGVDTDPGCILGTQRTNRFGRQKELSEQSLSKVHEEELRETLCLSACFLICWRICSCALFISLLRGVRVAFGFPGSSQHQHSFHSPHS